MEQSTPQKPKESLFKVSRITKKSFQLVTRDGSGQWIRTYINEKEAAELFDRLGMFFAES